MENNIIDEENIIDDASEYEFAGIIAQHLSNPRRMVQFASKVMQNAEEGDSASLKMIQQALADVKYQKDKKQILSDDQLKRIIEVTADRDRIKG